MLNKIKQFFKKIKSDFMEGYAVGQVKSAEIKINWRKKKK